MSNRRQLVASFLAFPVAGVSMQAQAQDATLNDTITKGIAYAERDGTPLLLDAYLPYSGDPPFPAVLLFHSSLDTMPIAQARTMVKALQQVGVSVVALEDAVGDHFTVADWANAGPWTRPSSVSSWATVERQFVDPGEPWTSRGEFIHCR